MCREGQRKACAHAHVWVLQYAVRDFVMQRCKPERDGAASRRASASSVPPTGVEGAEAEGFGGARSSGSTSLGAETA